MAGKYPDEVAELVKSAIEAATAALTGDDTATVTMDYTPRVELDTITGRHVLVSPAVSSDELLTREKDFIFTAIIVTVFNRYVSQTTGGPPPKAWVTAQIRWAIDYAKSPVTNVRLAPLGGVLVPVESSPIDLYDADQLTVKHVFEASFRVTYREEVVATA